MHQLKDSRQEKAQGSATSARAINQRASSKRTTTPSSPIIQNGAEKATGWLSTAKGKATAAKRQKSRRADRRDHLRIKEQWLREETRANRTLMLGLFQWGLAVLVGMETCLYYVRRDVATNLALHNALPTYGTVPPVRWFVGSAILTMVAIIFCAMSKYLIRRQVSYRTQLIEMKPSFSGITEGPTGGRINKYHYWLFLAFPLMDLVLWFYFRLTSSITIPW